MREERILMPNAQQSARRQIRLFQNDRLEQLTRVSPTGFAITWILLLALATALGWNTASIASSIGLVALGVLLWTLFEYGMHRFVFHLKMRSNFGQRLIFLAHGNHHAAPADRYRNLMPPLASIAINGPVWVLLLLIFGRAGSMVFAGFALGYMAYDCIHYACHQLPMRGRLMRRLRKHHNRHHYVDQDGNYAITAIFWDRVFGTHIPAKDRRMHDPCDWQGSV